MLHLFVIRGRLLKEMNAPVPRLAVRPEWDLFENFIGRVVSHA